MKTIISKVCKVFKVKTVDISTFLANILATLVLSVTSVFKKTISLAEDLQKVSKNKTEIDIFLLFLLIWSFKDSQKILICNPQKILICNFEVFSHEDWSDWVMSPWVWHFAEWIVYCLCGILPERLPTVCASISESYYQLFNSFIIFISSYQVRARLWRLLDTHVNMWLNHWFPDNSPSWYQETSTSTSLSVI